MRKANISIFVPNVGCPNMCSFCDQSTITGKTEIPRAADVQNAVETAVKKGGDFEYEIAFFGGSFTAIDRDYMLELLGAARPYVDDGTVTGIRISTRPDAIDEEILKILRYWGVTTIELGAQSTNNAVLELNKRGHTAEDIKTASELINKMGFELVLQMMTGLYGSNDIIDICTACELSSLMPSAVRIYPTVVLKGTELAELVENGKYRPNGVEHSVELAAALVKIFNANEIKVLRVGLHASEDIKENYVAGAYHEAFGELVDSKIMLDELMKLQKGKYNVKVNSNTVSKLVGHGKVNKQKLSQAGIDFKVVVDNSVEPGKFEAEKIG